MTQLRNNFEGQTNGGSLTAVNSGSSGSAFTSVTLTGGAATYSNAHPANGSIGIRFTPSGTAACYAENNNLSGTSWRKTLYFYYSGAPSAVTRIYMVRTAAGEAFGITVTTGGRFQLTDAIGNSASAVQSLTATTPNTANTRGGSLTTERIGNVIGGGWTDLYFDSLIVDDTSTSPLGPWTDPPTAAFTFYRAGLTLNVDGTTSAPVSPATITGYDWDWGDSTTHGTGSTASHTYAGAGTYSVVLTVTDSNGLTNSSTQSIVIKAPAGTVGVESVTVSTGWTATGGTILGVITDGDSSTLITSQSPPTSQEFDFILEAAVAPNPNQPFKVFIVADAPLSTSATVNAQLYEGTGQAFTTQRSSVSGTVIPSGSGSTVGTVIAIPFPWTDVQSMTTGGWNAPKVKLQITAS
jgi:PKD repeat protein